MQLQEVIRTAGTCRYYTDDPVTDADLRVLFDAARFAPQGGNRQPVRWVVVRDPGKKRQLRDWYLQTLDDYVDRRAGNGTRSRALTRALDFARDLDRVPVLVIVCAVMEDLHPTDTVLDRVGVVGGASIYPAVQNLLLTAREQGLGAALTTLLCQFEPRLQELLSIPQDVAVAAVVAVGHPARPFPTTLRRRPVAEHVFIDTFGDPLFPE